ncbi:ubiquitin-like domain-containing protein [Streptomyces sp. NPDC046197]|uniref:ubiquitin-like domain-containing protein n=1 Tax=Streptomyces sp. NPDC046197 TaxID=3154337 RepID=UPI0033EEE029
MSNPRYETYGSYGPSLHPAPQPLVYDPYAVPGGVHLGGPDDVHDAETLGYGVPGTPGAQMTHRAQAAYETAREDAYRPAVGGNAYGPAHQDTYTPAHESTHRPAHESTHRPAHEDTYRPAYEAAAPLLPRQGRGAPAGEGRAPGGRAGGAGRRGARRRRPRYAERPEANMRRLLPQALVVVFLAGGTTAFVAKDKAIELDVEGRPRTLHTFADDVTELLAEQGVRVGAHDVVAPAPGTALASGDEVAVRYGRPVRLTLDGHRHEVWTTARTVEGALRQLGVRAEGAYLSASRSQPIGRTGLALDVRTERTVTIMADGRARTVRTNAATVREAVEEAGITLRGQDTTSVAPGSFPRDGQTVTVLRITGTREAREEPIPFSVQRVADPSLFRGTEVVDRAGQPGVRRITYALRTVNGVREKPRRIATQVVREPQPQVIRVGTKAHPPSVRGTDHLDWHGLAACESGGRPDAVDPSGTYGGLYQFDNGTWHSLGGTGRPQDAPADEQTYRAKKLYLKRGASPWPHCGQRLHG